MELPPRSCLLTNALEASDMCDMATLVQGRRGGRRAAAGCGSGGQELGGRRKRCRRGGRVEWVGLAAARPGPGGQYRQGYDVGVLLTQSPCGMLAWLPHPQMWYICKLNFSLMLYM